MYNIFELTSQNVSKKIDPVWTLIKILSIPYEE